jgi:hypothetical protein
MAKTTLFILFLLTFLSTFSFSLAIFYHFQRFRPLIPFGEKKILSLLFFGQFFFFLLSLFSFFLI